MMPEVMPAIEGMTRKPIARGVSAMPVQQNVTSLVDPGGQVGRAALVGVQPLHEVLVGPADRLVGGARRKAEDLIGLLRGHRARSAPSRPRVSISICVFTPSGEAAVEISL